MEIRCGEILVPNKSVDLRNWSVVSCDQFTTDKEYWDSIRNKKEDFPTAAKLVIPEVYLPLQDENKEIEEVQHEMKKYLDDKIFDVITKNAVCIQRIFPSGNKRIGIVCEIDLEEYSFNLSDKAKIRSTEEIDENKVKTRLKVREGAPLELPHIIIFADDDKGVFIPKEINSSQKELYSFEGKKNAGEIKGTLISSRKVISGFKKYKKHMKKKYPNDNILFLVGDGNHSLVAAKKYWEEIKPELTEKEKRDHKARFALCEIVDINSLETFQSINRVLTNVDKKAVKNFFGTEENILDYSNVQDKNSIETIIEVDKKIDEFVKENPKAKKEYIYTEEEIENGKKDSSLILLVPTIKRSDLFPYCIAHGNLPKKTFSIGVGEEKRYYLEAKRI